MAWVEGIEAIELQRFFSLSPERGEGWGEGWLD